MLERGKSKYLITPVGRAVIGLLSREDDDVLDIVEYLYAGKDWRGFPNIQFIVEEPTYERGNIFVIF
jgi:hypothetical protein